MRPKAFYRSVYGVSQISVIFYPKSSFLQLIYKKIMTILAYNVQILCVLLTIIQYAYILKQFATSSYFLLPPNQRFGGI
jgi:hypothetical protein